MLRRRTRSTFQWGYMPSAFALLALLSGCDPKWRELKEGAPPDQGQVRLQPAQDETPSSNADVLSPSSDDVEIVCSDGDCPQSAGAVDSSETNDTCGAGDDAGACSPVPLCEGDAGSCEATCPGCFVEGTCVAGDAVNPGNPCLICNPGIDPRGWSNNDGVTCDDGLFCTTDDVCAASVCKSTPLQCEDGVACNGVSKCDETAAKCTDDLNQCGANALCNVQTDSCVSTCPGCIINGVCLTVGTEASGNPCSVCDPTRSTTTFSAAAGKNCGAGPTACSQQDTCDSQGRCQQNHLPATSSCGNPASGSCDQPDTCDGNGNCQQRLSQNGAACDDGAFCTTGDQCQGGQCRPTGNQNCGANRTCNEAADQCQCQGCQIGNTCVAPGSTNPANACQICDLSRSATAYSVNMGASCGSAATECSGQDTCNAQGQCAANNLAPGVTCTSVPRGGCQNGVCVTATLPNGSSCRNGSECSSGRCDTWYRDRDGDGYGTAAAADVLKSCGGPNGAPVAMAGFVVADGRPVDCCDLEGANRTVAARIFPGQPAFFDTPQLVCPNVNQYDYNCDGAAEYIHQDATERSRAPGGAATCGFTPFALCGAPHWTDPEVVVCGQLGFREVCGQVFPNTPPFENLGCATGDIVGLTVACR